MNQERPIVAAFDFDGTLTTRDSLLPFLLYTTGFGKSTLNFLLEAPTLIGYLIGIISRQKTKERILTRFFANTPISSLLPQAQQFALHKIPSLLKPKAIERLQWHLRQGHRCLVISASIDLYLKPWCETAGIDTLICSRLEVDADQRVTGKLIGLNCWGPEKVRRLEELFGPKESYTLYAYGDSRGDRELLALADHAYFGTMP